MRVALSVAFLLATSCGGSSGPLGGKHYDTRSSLMSGLDAGGRQDSGGEVASDSADIPHYDLVFDGSDMVISVLVLRINLLREEEGLDPLAPSQALNLEAQKNSDAMADVSYIDCSGADMAKAKKGSGFGSVYCFVRAVANMDELLGLLPVMDGATVSGVLAPDMKAVGAGIAVREQVATGETMLLYTLLFAR